MWHLPGCSTVRTEPSIRYWCYYLLVLYTKPRDGLHMLTRTLSSSGCRLVVPKISPKKSLVQTATIAKLSALWFPGLGTCRTRGLTRPASRGQTAESQALRRPGAGAPSWALPPFVQRRRGQPSHLKRKIPLTLSSGHYCLPWNLLLKSRPVEIYEDETF